MVKYTKEIIQQIVEDKGYKLVAFKKANKNNNFKPKIIISNGYEEKEMYFDNFKRGKFKMKPNTTDSIKDKVEKHYGIKLDYVKCISQSKRNMDDVLELSFKNKVIQRRIGNILNSLNAKNNNIFTKKRKTKITYEEVFKKLSNPINKIDSFEIIYDETQGFSRETAKFKLNIQGAFYFYKYKSLMKRLSLVTDSIPFTPHKSQGELKIMNVLSKMNVNYITEKMFNGCCDESKLRFDFYLPMKNICIEFDGKHHFKEVDFYKMKTDFKDIQKKDRIKNEYCKKHNIKLYRIPYTKLNHIEEILQDIVSSN